MKKKVLAIVTAALIGTTAFAATASAASGTIDVISREDGSGTRGAFIELFGIEEKQGDEKVDMTTEDASITNSTSVMMTTVAGDENAIGYISLGSLNDTVKAVKIDGAEASAENVANDTYKVSRPFNIITTDKLSDAAQDFENYIMSADGQQIVEDNGYIKVADDAKAYEQSDAEGKVVVAGSSSVTPVMEKLKEAYEKANGGKLTVQIERIDTEVAVGIVHVGRKLGAVEICNGVASAMSLLEHRTVAVEPAAVTRENNGITVVIVLVVDVSGVIDMENKGDGILFGSRCDTVGIKARSEALTHVVKAKIFRLRRHSAVFDIYHLGQILCLSLLPVGCGLDLAAVLHPQQLGKRTIENIVFVHNFILSVYVCLYIDQFTVLFSAVPYGTSHCLRQITARADNRAAHGLPHLFHRDRSI